MIGFVLTFAVQGRDVGAQTVSDVLTFLVTNETVVTGSVDRDLAAAQATRDTIARALAVNLATLPLTTSSGAFVYRLNPELGTVERATQSFGPFFIERAVTTGARRASFGLNVQHFRFTSLDGRNLRDGSLVTTANQFVDEAIPFDVDQLTLNIDASVAAFHGTIGVSDRLDVGFAIPIVALRVDGTRVNTYRGRTFTQARATASAIGLADVVVRSKYRLMNEDSAGLAVAADVRLPTGKREDLLGAGTASAKFSGIASLERGRWAIHANAGVSVGGLARELDYGGALEAAATQHFTVTTELVGRWQDSPGGITTVSGPNPNLVDVRTVRLLPDTSTTNTLTLAPGAKWNVSALWVLGFSVAVPLTHAGLTSRVTPFVGLEYGFGR